MTGLVERAARFAILAHSGQKRKYTGEPYLVHLEEVADLVDRAGVRDEVVAAAWLHDVLEDTTVDVLELTREFGLDIASMVSMLTDTVARPGVNRAARKALDRERLAQATPEVHTIKLADLVSNTKSIVGHDPKFAVTYLDEKARLLPMLQDGDAGLRDQATRMLLEGQRALVQHALSQKPRQEPEAE